MSSKCEKAYIKVIGRSAVIRTERGSKALVSLENLCRYAQRLGLCIENYKC